MYYIGIDLGGTNIAAGIVDNQFRIVKKGSTPTMPERSAEEIVKDMASLCLQLLREADLTAKDIAYTESQRRGWRTETTALWNIAAICRSAIFR